MELAFDALIIRFLEKVERAESGCWNWTGYKYPTGYGAFTIKGKPILAHRFAYLTFVDSNLPETYVIHHTCGNKICVNPQHLEKMFRRAHYLKHYRERRGWK